MKGDVDEAQSRVADPFADYNNLRQPESQIKATNTKEIASWDEGLAAAKNQSNQQEHTKKIRNDDNRETPKQPAATTKPNAWKEWDEN